MRFWDASAVVPLLYKEPESRPMLELVEQDSELVVWWGTEVECASAIVRRERGGELPPGPAKAALLRLDELARGWVEIEPSEQVRRQARRLLRAHALRAQDALQLAAAVVAASGDERSLPLVCLDRRLADAAEIEGFPIV